MCSPTFATAAVGMQAAGAASSVVGSYYSAQSQKSTLGLQADLDEYQAQNALLQGEREEQKARLSTAQLKSSQRANMAANGVDLAQGSAAQVLTSTDYLGEVDAQTIKANALKQALGYRVDATMKRAQADSISPGMAAFTTLLGSGAQVASSWYGLNKAGAFSSTTGQYDPRDAIRGQKGYN